MMEDREIGYINVIPLVDIMLVLLTIVLTTATFISTGEISVNLPEAKRANQATTKPLSIVITKDERLFFEGHELSTEELTEKVRKLCPETPILIRADERILLGKFVTVVDVLKGAGLKNLSIQVRKE